MKSANKRAPPRPRATQATLVHPCSGPVIRAQVSRKIALETAQQGIDDPARQRRQHHGQAHDAAPDRPGMGAFTFVVEGVADHRQRRCQQQRRPHALQRPCQVQGRRRRRQRAGQRGGGKEQDAARQHTLAAEAVGRGASRQQQGGKAQHVAAHHPFDLAEGGPQLACHRGQDDADHVGIQHRHGTPERTGQQDASRRSGKWPAHALAPCSVCRVNGVCWRLTSARQHRPWRCPRHAGACRPRRQWHRQSDPRPPAARRRASARSHAP